MKSYNKLTEKDKEIIIKEYYENKSYKDISIKYNFSMRSIPRVLIESGINTNLKNRYTLNSNYFNNIDNQNKAYWLGFLHADGFVGDNKYNNIVLSSIDKEHIIKFGNEIEYTGKYRISKGGYENSKNQLVINFSDKTMSKNLRDLGIESNRKLKNYKIPNINEEFIPHFIRGYFDGDGSVYSYTNTHYHKNKSYTYLVRIVSIIGPEPFLNEIGSFMPYKYRIKDSKTDSLKYMEFYISSEFEDIYDYLYKNANIYLLRKYNKFNELLSPLEE